MITGRKYVLRLLREDQIRLTKDYSRIVTSKGKSPYQDEANSAMILIQERIQNIDQAIEILEVI